MKLNPGPQSCGSWILAAGPALLCAMLCAILMHRRRRASRCAAQVAVDSVGSGAAAYEDGSAGGPGLRLALGNPAVRVALAAGALLGATALLPLLGSDVEQVGCGPGLGFA